MVSAINATLPANGVLAQKSDLRANLLAAKNEIEALQNEAVNTRAALGLSASDALFPVIAGDNLPLDPATFQTIIQALDAAITAAAAGGGGGPITLADITDILTPTEAQRIVFQKPADAGSIDADFNFSEGTHAGKWIGLNSTLNPVTMTLPAAASINRDDGWLCRVTATSGANFAAVTGPTDALRFQTQRFGAQETQTTVFLGRSRSAGFRSLFDIYKDGSLFQIDGPGRVTETDDLRIGTPGSLDAAVLTALSLLDDAFPNLLDLGGTKQAGGGRGLQETVAGNHTFVQANSGKALIHTGGGAATWTVPALLGASTVEVINTGGPITFSVTGGQTPIGGLTLGSELTGAVRWLITGEVLFVGTA